MQSTPKTPNMRWRPARGQRATLLFLFLALTAGFVGHQGFAADSGKTITLGESLSEPQRQELLDFFGASGDDRVETVTVADTKAAMEGIIDRNISSAFSSTALTCRELGEGLDVRTRNITLITPSLYAMALVTAGIGDATLLVAAPNDAPAEGMTALTGVFNAWDSAPCDSGNTSKARQRLALQQLALAVEIGQIFATPDGMKLAADIVLFTQQAVVVNGLTEADEISAAIADQEAVRGVSIPAEQRQQLVDLMVELAAEDIDWSTFSAGWTIEPTGDNTGIEMKGDGIAIRNAQLTATVRAAENQTATAEARAERDATKQAEAAGLTATARAEMNEEELAAAMATQEAIDAALTATAAAAPVTTPEATATPAPVAIAGEVTNIRGGQVWVRPDGADDVVAYTVPIDADITRGGERATLESIETGDSVSLTIDGYSNTVRQLSATAPSAGFMSGIAKFLYLIPALAVIPLILLLRGRSAGGDPFVVKRIASA